MYSSNTVNVLSCLYKIQILTDSVNHEFLIFTAYTGAPLFDQKNQYITLYYQRYIYSINSWYVL